MSGKDRTNEPRPSDQPIRCIGGPLHGETVNVRPWEDGGIFGRARDGHYVVRGDRAEWVQT